jgi:hypothetical protein
MKGESSVGSQLDDLATQAGWERQPARTLSVARAIYLRLPDDARLWLRAREFAVPDKQAIRTVLRPAALGTVGDATWR